MQRITTILLALTMLPAFLYAQEVIILPDSKLVKDVKNSENLEVRYTKRINQGIRINQNVTEKLSYTNDRLNYIDTLYTITDPYNPISYGSNFGFLGQDVLIQWFEAPADLQIQEVGFSFYSAYDPVAVLEMKIIESNYPIDSLQYLNNELWGYFQSPYGCHESAAAFFDTSTSGWLSINGHLPPFGPDLWSDGGDGFPFTPITDSVGITYQFIDLNILGYPEILAGTIFGVVLKNTSIIGTSRVGLRGTSVGNDGVNQYSLFKFYCDGNPNQPPEDDWSWWSQDVTLGFAAVVDIYGPLEVEVNPPYEFALEQNYPNPFNPNTSIQYAVSSRQFVSLKIYDVLGNEVATLVNEEKPAGSYVVEFYGNGLPSGVYFYQLKADSYIKTKKMIIIK